MDKDKKHEQKVYNGLYSKNRKKKEKWERPMLEDVSGKVMAQPYIRFT